MNYESLPVEEPLRSQLKEYCHDAIGCLFEVHSDLGQGMPEYLYQEACKIVFDEHGYDCVKEYQHHPIFHGKTMESYLKMDLLLRMPKGNIVIECKAIKEITNKEQYQLFSYLRGTEFPIGLLVNFATWPKLQVQRYYYNRKTKQIRPF